MTDNRPDDEILDERIRALAAAQYHAPEGQVPRDAMWAQIAAARRAARAGVHATAPAAVPVREADVVPLAPRRSRTVVVAGWGALLAAGLVLGVALERERSSDRVSTPGSVAVVPEPRDSAPIAATESTNVRSPGTTPDAAPSVRETVPAPRRMRDVTQPRGTDYAAVTPEPRDLPAVSDSTVQTLYRAAAVQTLMQAEALLTAYRGAGTAPRDPATMRQAARWARDVLSSTRLLLDSPAGRDPQMKMLFTDLELILAQIVQLSGTPLQAHERELIERAMQERDLLPRIRSAVPSGSATS